MKNNMTKYAGVLLASTVVVGGIASAAITQIPTISNTFAVAGQTITAASINKLAEAINILNLRTNGSQDFDFGGKKGVNLATPTANTDAVTKGYVDTNAIIPGGAIMPFNLASCPTGWIAADGANSTPDLRGQFIRGLNDFGTGARTDGKEDPDGTARTLASWQADEFKSHKHPITSYSLADNYGTAMYTDAFEPAKTYTSNNAPDAMGAVGGSETRSRNMAFIYCIEQ